jgi:hypothetical protein
MECKVCGGELKKYKYMKKDDFKKYIEINFEDKELKSYEDFLLNLNADEFVLTRFTRTYDQKVTVKYYIRIIEVIKKEGIKLKGLAKYFNLCNGELIYNFDNTIHINYVNNTIYKILKINSNTDRIIRDYYNTNVNFDIVELNKIISKSFNEVNCNLINHFE